MSMDGWLATGRIIGARESNAMLAIRPRIRRTVAAVAAIALAFVFASCGLFGNAERTREAEAATARAQASAERAEKAAEEAKKAAEQATIAADKAAKAVQDADKEINRASEHINAMAKELEQQKKNK